MTKDLPTTKIFTTGQVAEICNVAIRTVNKWCDSNRLPATRLSDGGHRRINKKDLIDFCKNHDMKWALLSLDALVPKKPTPVSVINEVVDLVDDKLKHSFLPILRHALKTCCTDCDVRKECEFAYDLYNEGCEPKIDCLATK